MHAVSGRLRIAGSALLACAFALSLGSAGCHVGASNPPGDDESGPDGSPSSPSIDAAATGGGDGCTDLDTNVTETGTHPTGYDFDQGGQGCLGGLCHQAGGVQGPAWTIAGSVFNQLQTGGSPVAGAHVFIKDSGGREIELITATNGSFWTNEALSPPFSTSVSGCPDLQKMVAFSANGNCNQGGCHVETYKIFLPSAP